MYRLELTKRAQRELNELPDRDHERLVAGIRGLAADPRRSGSRKIRRNIHRMRIGDWRIIYAVFDKDKLVIVGKVARRSKSTYDNVEEMF